MQAIIDKILDFLSALPKELIVAIISILPIIEVRGAIPIAMTVYKMPPLTAAGLALVASMLPVPIILLAIKSVIKYFKTTRIFRGFALWLEGKTEGKNARAIHKYGALGLIIFVGIPLPGTGVWTGSLIAALLGIDFKWAFLSVLLGDIIATIIVTLISTGIVHFF